jgi:hypothetical protein
VPIGQVKYDVWCGFCERINEFGSSAAFAEQSHAVPGIALSIDQLFACGMQFGNRINTVRALANRKATAEIVQAFLPVQAQYCVVLVSLLTIFEWLDCITIVPSTPGRLVARSLPATKSIRLGRLKPVTCDSVVRRSRLRSWTGR